MKARRNQHPRSLGATSRLSSPAGPDHTWVRLSKADAKDIRDLVTEGAASKERKLFAVVGRLQTSASGEKRARQVLVFDNHPDTLRLLFDDNQPARPAAPARGRRGVHLLLAVSLFALLLAAMFWPVVEPMITHSKEGAASNSSVAMQNPADVPWQRVSAR